jgi:eukaryotic-like serine/threonine-protein kinase
MWRGDVTSNNYFKDRSSMSILDKKLADTPVRKSRRVRIIIASIALMLLIVLLVFTNIGSDAALVGHFFTPPSHFTYSGHANYVSSVAWSPDAKRIASASGDGTVQVWSAQTGSKIYTYRGHSGDVLCLAWSPDGKYIASGGLDTTVQVWDASDGHHIYTYHGHADAIFSVAWSPDETRIASASNDGTVQVWDATSGTHVLKVSGVASRGAPAPWNAVAWSPDGKRIAIGGNGPAQVLDATTGQIIAYYGYHGGIVHTAAWSPDGTYLAIGDSDFTVQVWNVATVRNVYTYSGHTSDVLAVAWSPDGPDGKRIASGSSDGTVQVWDALTGGHVYVYRGHADFALGHFTGGSAVNSVAWSPDGKRIASGGNDATVQVWPVE